ncbi:MAG: methylmalonyl Co-A mutase-associated GTPase MeaB [Bacteroidota bacterium]
MNQTEEEFKSALKVNDGIEPPSQVNSEAIKLMQNARKEILSLDVYVKGITSGDRVMLSKAITLIESALQKHNALAQQIIEKCLPHSGKSIRIGITGVPGVGKSTFIEALGKHITSNGYKLAVLAVDPSSQRSKGSILGDKTRMEALSVDPNAFIRPSPSAGSLGGVARKTRETILLCEAAGFNVIFIETVGVGQSETVVHSMVDFFLLLMLAGAGDELQGIKRGIMEMADAIAINKADGDNIRNAQRAKTEYSNALRLFPPTLSGWKPVVETCSSRTMQGIDDIWNLIIENHHMLQQNGFFAQQRLNQQKHLMYETIHQALKDHFYNDETVAQQLHLFEKKVVESNISSYVAAQQLLDEYFGKHQQ